MSEYQIDTNVILRYLVGDDAKKSTQIKTMMREAKEGNVRLFLSEPIILEVAVGLRNYYKYSKEKIAELLRIICNLELLKIENKDIIISTLHYYETYALDFADCLLLSRVKKYNQKLFSFDEKLVEISWKI